MKVTPRDQLLKLEREIDAFAEQAPQLSVDNLFVGWFVRAYLTESDSAALESVTGGAKDKALDAILLDEKARVAYLVQAKYRRQHFGKAEPRGSVIEFASLAQTVCDADGVAFADFMKDIDPATGEVLKEA